MMKVGMPGTAGMVSREIGVVMKETEDGGMIFEPASIAVEKGQTVRFKLVNAGELEHEFILGDRGAILEHKAETEVADAMAHHDDPNSLRLAPGMQGELVWTFANPGRFEFACLIPGHYDAGMKGALTVSEN